MRHIIKCVASFCCAPMHSHVLFNWVGLYGPMGLGPGPWAGESGWWVGRLWCMGRSGRAAKGVHLPGGEIQQVQFSLRLWEASAHVGFSPRGGSKSKVDFAWRPTPHHTPPHHTIPSHTTCHCYARKGHENTSCGSFKLHAFFQHCANGQTHLVRPAMPAPVSDYPSLTAARSGSPWKVRLAADGWPLRGRRPRVPCGTVWLV
jgi:hypothetical protein